MECLFAGAMNMIWKQDPEKWALLMRTQVDVSYHNVDFALWSPNQDPDNDLPLVTVEVDGHNFHEKTKQQVEKDKSRDRDLTRLGIAVLRYAGSEVFRDPFGSAYEAMAHALKLAGDANHPRLL
jgi:very-short-patch-repair endonuclease